MNQVVKQLVDTMITGSGPVQAIHDGSGWYGVAGPDAEYAADLIGATPSVWWASKKRGNNASTILILWISTWEMDHMMKKGDRPVQIQEVSNASRRSWR